jgi:small subunit ribosomal protein S4
MAKNLDSTCKKCRREGAKLFLKGEKCNSPKCPVLKRNYPPGAHGPKGNKRSTEYGQQLREKQKAKKIYAILERQFRNYYRKAIRQKGDTGEILRQMLELRFDNVVYRSGLVSSRAMARQLISHGFFFIKGKKVNIPSYQMKPKDEITINPNKSKAKAFAGLDLEKQDNIISWLFVSKPEMKIKIVSKPTAEDFDQSFNPRLIVEFYSR